MSLGIIGEDGIVALEHAFAVYGKEDVKDLKMHQVIDLIKLAYDQNVSIDVIKNCLIKNIKIRSNLCLQVFWSNQNGERLIKSNFSVELFEILMFDAKISPVALINKSTMMKQLMWDMCVKWC